MRLDFIWLATKCSGDVHELPGLDVIVGVVPSMDIALDRIAIVANDKAFFSVSICLWKCTQSSHRVINSTYMIGFKPFLIIVLTS
jgi:hypothetical protein